MKTNVALIFFLKKPKNYVFGPVPIYLRITVNGRRAEFSCGRTCDVKRWNSGTGRAIGTKEDVRSLNGYLDTLQRKMYNAQCDLVDEQTEITVESLKEKFSGREKQSYFLLDLFREHNSRVESLLGNGFAPNTLKGYRTSLRHLTGFLSKMFNCSDIDIHKVNYEFITDYEFYLRSSCGCSAVSAAKYMKHFKKLINHCLANQWITIDPFFKYKSVARPKEREFLTQAELNNIAEKKFALPRLEQVKDIFLFSCYTGLAYIDVQKLKRIDVAKGVDGNLWVLTRREKTETSTRIPLLPMAIDIMEKYEQNPVCLNKGLLLPVLSNQRMNSYLKEIADVCGINKTLTFHIARHTFATTVTLSNGVPIESVSKMLGHTTIKTTQHYAKILDIKVSQDMTRLKSILTRNEN